MTISVAAYAAVAVNETGAPSAGQSSAQLAANLAPIYFPNGDGNGQVSQAYFAKRTVAESATDTIVLSTGLIDALGNAVDFTTIKGILIVADIANPGDLVVGDAATHPFEGWFGATTSVEHVPPGGLSMHVNPGAGWAVGSGASDQLAIVNSSGAGSADYTIILWG